MAQARQEFNVVLVGVPKSGKSALCKYITDEPFSDDYEPTKWMDEFKLDQDNKAFYFMDYGGGDDSFIKQARIAAVSKQPITLFVYDSTQSFQTQQPYLQGMKNKCRADAHCFLVITKMDNQEFKDLKDAGDIQALAGALEAKATFSCSAKRRIGGNALLTQLFAIEKSENDPLIDEIEKQVLDPLRVELDRLKSDHKLVGVGEGIQLQVNEVEEVKEAKAKSTRLGQRLKAYKANMDMLERMHACERAKVLDGVIGKLDDVVTDLYKGKLTLANKAQIRERLENCIKPKLAVLDKRSAEYDKHGQLKKNLLRALNAISIIFLIPVAAKYLFHSSHYGIYRVKGKTYDAGDKAISRINKLKGLGKK